MPNVDDILVYQKSQHDLMDAWRWLFKRCKEFGYKLHPNKLVLYPTEGKFNGRVYKTGGVSFDQKRLQGLTDIGVPETAGQLLQWLCAVNFVRKHLPNHSRIIAPLQERLQSHLAGTSRKMKDASKIFLKLTEEEIICFNNTKKSIKNAAELAFLDSSKEVCFSADASELGWAVAATQVRSEDLCLEYDDMGHEPLAYISGLFTGAQKNWAIPDKEAFATLQGFIKLPDLIPVGKKIHLSRTIKI